MIKLLIEQRFGRPSVPQTPQISEPARISSEIFNNPKIQEAVAVVNREYKLLLYGKPLKDEDGTEVPWQL